MFRSLKSLPKILAVVAFLVTPTFSGAATYSFSPSLWSGGVLGSDLEDLSHWQLYLWSINSAIPGNEVVTGATISISNLYDWKIEPNILKFYLLDNPYKSDIAGRVDVVSIVDMELTDPANEIPYYAGSKFDEATKLGVTFTDADGPATVDQFAYSFSDVEIALLSQYLFSPNSASNATIGLGLDPDCRFYNDGVTFTVTTQAPPVPEPATLLLLGSGLAGALAVRRRRAKNA